MRSLMVIAFFVICGIIYWSGKNSQQAVTACKAAGVQSDQTCDFYSY